MTMKETNILRVGQNFPIFWTLGIFNVIHEAENRAGVKLYKIVTKSKYNGNGLGCAFGSLYPDSSTVDFFHFKTDFS